MWHGKVSVLQLSFNSLHFPTISSHLGPVLSWDHKPPVDVVAMAHGPRSHHLADGLQELRWQAPLHHRDPLSKFCLCGLSNQTLCA